MPINIFYAMSIGLSSEKMLTTQVWVVLAEGNQQPEESEQVTIFLDLVPVEPVHIVILAVGIVITSLCTPYLIACQDHGNALREHENSEEILDLTQA